MPANALRFDFSGAAFATAVAILAAGPVAWLVETWLDPAFASYGYVYFVLVTALAVWSILLARLTQALPRGSALTAFRLDSSEASVVTMGRNVMAVLASLETVPAIAGLKATAPVTREIVNGVTLERVSLAFTLRPPASDRIEVRTSSARTVRERP